MSGTLVLVMVVVDVVDGLVVLVSIVVLNGDEAVVNEVVKVLAVTFTFIFVLGTMVMVLVSMLVFDGDKAVVVLAEDGFVAVLVDNVSAMELVGIAVVEVVEVLPVVELVVMGLLAEVVVKLIVEP